MIDKYKKFVERVGDDEWEGEHNFSDYDNKDARDIAKDAYESYDDDDDDLEDDEDMEHLKYLLRSMFKNKGFDSISITNSSLDINLRVMLSHREKLSDLVSLFDIVNKLRSDILPQYSCQFEMWYNKQGQTMEFDFTIDDNDNNDFFDDEDDDEDYIKASDENKKFVSKFLSENGR